MKAVAIFGVGLVAIIGIAVMVLFSYNNKGSQMEEHIVGIHKVSQSVATRYQNTIMEMAQVPEMQRDDVKEVITAALEGRYGADGSQAVFQAINESNPQIDSTVYVKLQQTMESGRKDFEREQRRMVDAVSTYKTELRKMPSGFFLRMLGFPTIDLALYEPVTTERVREMFETKTEEHIKLR